MAICAADLPAEKAAQTRFLVRGDECFRNGFGVRCGVDIAAQDVVDWYVDEDALTRRDGKEEGRFVLFLDPTVLRIRPLERQRPIRLPTPSLPSSFQNNGRRRSTGIYLDFVISLLLTNTSFLRPLRIELARLQCPGRSPLILEAGALALQSAPRTV